jgi:hypothetical protein
MNDLTAGERVVGADAPEIRPSCLFCGRTLVDGGHHPVTAPPYCFWSTDYCPDGGEHVWGEDELTVAEAGPIEGSWISAECVRCGVGGMSSVEDPDGSLAAVLGALEAKGCIPEALS